MGSRLVGLTVTTLAMFAGAWGCEPVARPEHCANQGWSGTASACPDGQLCTNSRCPALAPLSANDRGCRYHNHVFAAAARSGEAWAQWESCLVGVEPTLLDQLRYTVEQGHVGATSGTGGVGTPGDDASFGPSCDVTGSHAPAPEPGGGMPDPAQGLECRSDSDCLASPSAQARPFCDIDAGRCVTCVPGSMHCTDPRKSVCGERLGRRSCEACFSDVDCARTGAGSFCAERIDEQGEFEPRCVDCNDDHDCETSPGRPYCLRPSDGSAPRCVACIRGSDCGLGDGSMSCRNHTCVGCTLFEDECHGNATCWMWPGAERSCSTHVLYVDGNQTDRCLAADGSESSPFCTLEDALRSIAPGQSTTVYLSGDLTLQRGVAMTSGTRIHLVGQTNAILTMAGTSGNLMTVLEDAQLTLARLELRSSPAAAISCKGPSTQIVMSDVIVRGGQGPGIELDGCSLVGERVEVIGHAGFGVSTFNSIIKLSSSIVAANGAQASPVGGGFLLRGLSRIELDHVTIAGNHSSASGSMIRCQGPRNQVSIRSGLLVAESGTEPVSCTDASLRVVRNFSNLELLAGDHGKTLPDPGRIRRLFRAESSLNYRMVEVMPSDPELQVVASLGRWHKGDAAYDIDGNLWPDGPGFVGADQARDVLKGAKAPDLGSRIARWLTGLLISGK